MFLSEREAKSVQRASVPFKKKKGGRYIGFIVISSVVVVVVADLPAVAMVHFK